MADLHRVLIIGVGSIGHRHLRCFQATGRAEVSICEINPELRAKLAEQYHVSQAYADLDAALADGPTAAVINTPAHLHVAMARRLVEAGCHVLIEKPLSTGLAGVSELAEAVRRRGVVAALAYVYHAHPVLQAMRQAIASGRFGEPVQLTAVSGQHFPTFRPAYREIYYRDRATGGGAVQDALTHVLNACEWLVGPIDRILADAAHQVLEGVAVEDTVHALARHGATLASYSLNQHQAPSEMTITVVCRQGTVRFEGHRWRWRWMPGPEQPWHDEPSPELPRDELFVRQAHGFLDAIQGRCPPLCTLEEGIQTLRVNLAALESADRQRWVEVGAEPLRTPAS